jgi:PAS domain S-box-containing protein
MHGAESSPESSLAGIERPILEALPSFAIIADTAGVIMWMSRFASELSGWEPHEIEGLSIAEYLAIIQHADRNGVPLKAHELPLARALKGESITGWEGSFSRRNGERVAIVGNAAPLRGMEDEVLGAISSITDVRKLRSRERELRALYDELGHRMKNHMQLMSSFIDLEGREAHGALARMVERLEARTSALAAMYNKMNQSEVGGSVLARAFIEQIIAPYRTPSIVIDAAIPEDLILSHEQAAPVGMLINEAVCNSYKHAFPNRDGHIAIIMRKNLSDQLEMEISDDGVGYHSALKDKGPHGLNLMRMHARQLGADIEFSNRPSGGARVFAAVTHEAPAAAEFDPDGGETGRDVD